MLTRVRLGPYGTTGVLLEYGLDPKKGGYDLISADGLEPPPVNVTYTDRALVPGGSYHSGVSGVRSLSFRIGLRPTPETSVLRLRRELYYKLPPGEPISIRFWNKEDYELRIDGYLETISNDQFTKDPEVLVSLICTDPYFRSTTTVQHDNLPPNHTITLTNDGDIPTGFEVNFNITGGFRNTLRLYNDTTDTRVDVLRQWDRNTQVRIVTTQGAREVTLRNSGGSLIDHLLGLTEVPNGWPLLVRGDNEIRAWAANTEGGWNWSTKHTPLYGGF